MIISQISSKHLLIIQQLLLIHYNTSMIALHILYNIQSLALENLKYALSKLYSVLIFIPKEERGWREPFPSIMHSSWNSCSTRHDQGNTDLRISVTTLLWPLKYCVFSKLCMWWMGSHVVCHSFPVTFLAVNGISRWENSKAMRITSCISRWDFPS